VAPITDPPRRPGVCGQVSCRMTITRMMMTSTPMIVPIIPRFMENLLSCLSTYPRTAEVNTQPCN
jgi:hypothetical protein